MKIPHYTFDHSIRLYNLGDVHRAHPLCDEEFFNMVVNEILNDPLTYWISTGDLGELALKDSKGDVYDAQSPQWELDMLKSELSPIAHKGFGFVYSNHHKRTATSSGLNFDKILAEYLGIPYLGMTGYIAITLGRGTYYVVLHHGVGGGSRGNKINRARQLSMQRPGADLYMTGHVHTYDHFPLYQKYIDKKRLTVAKMLSWHQITGHFLSYDESYADGMMLEESPLACGVVDLGHCKHGRYNGKRIQCRMVTPYSGSYANKKIKFQN